MANEKVLLYSVIRWINDELKGRAHFDFSYPYACHNTYNNVEFWASKDTNVYTHKHIYFIEYVERLRMIVESRVLFSSNLHPDHWSDISLKTQHRRLGEFSPWKRFLLFVYGISCSFIVLSQSFFYAHILSYCTCKYSHYWKFDFYIIIFILINWFFEPTMESLGNSEAHLGFGWSIDSYWLNANRIEV